jgi:hypothetical protein
MIIGEESHAWLEVADVRDCIWVKRAHRSQLGKAYVGVSMLVVISTT